MKPLKIRPAAENDLLEAAAWYDGEREGLGDELLDEVTTTLRRIEEMPEMYARVDGPIRRALVRRFPYGVFYMIDGDAVVVTAVLHLHRRPETWKSRR